MRYKLCTISVIFILFTTSCVQLRDEQAASILSQELGITVSEARDFYETDIMSRAETECKSPNVLSPGDYTPQWDNAEVSQNNRIACVDVPIIPTYRYRAIRSEFSRGHAKAYKVDVSQKLVIVKDRESGAMASYIMSLIPDKGFAAKHKGNISNIFLNANDRGGFSGMIVYTYHNTPIRLSKYVKGKRVEGISTCGVSDKQQYRERLQQIYQSLGCIKIHRCSGITSRTEDDNWDVDGGEIEDVVVTVPGNEGGDGEEEGDGPPNQQPDPEDPTKDPLENPDDEGDIGNDGNDGDDKDTNENNDNSTFRQVKDDVLSRLSSSKMKLFIKKALIHIVTSDFTYSLRISGSKLLDVYMGTLEYNSSYFNSLNSNGQMLAVFHEYLHGFLYNSSNGTSYGHRAMLDSDEYKQGIRDLFPNESEKFYNMIQYAGCADIISNELDRETAKETREFIKISYTTNSKSQ